MKEKLYLLPTGILPAAVITGLGQSTVRFSTSIYHVPEPVDQFLLVVQPTGDTSAAVSVEHASAIGCQRAVESGQWRAVQNQPWVR